MSERLLALAEGQGGVLSAADATRLDVDPNALAALVRAGSVVRVRRGAYVLDQHWAKASPERRLDLRTRAVLHARGRALEAATHQSALAVHGLPLHGVDTDVVDLVGQVTRVRRAAGLRLHPADHDHPVEVVDGCPTVPAEVALVQVALREGRDPAVVSADRALALGVVELNRVLDLVDRLAETSRQASRTRRWLSQTDAASESVGETRTRLLLLDLGFDVRSQVRIADAGEPFARVDLLVGERVVVEFDGLLKYEGADGRLALAAEKAREDRLRALGYEVVRLTWPDLGRPRRVEAMVRSALERAAARDPRSTAS